MNRTMMARRVELVLGDAQEALQNRRKAIKAKTVGARVDATLMTEDAKEWATSRVRNMRGCMDEGRYAVSDAMDDIDYAMFKDNAKARMVTVITVTAGVALVVLVIAGVRLRRRIRL